VVSPPGSVASSRRSPPFLPIIMPDIRQQAESPAEFTPTTPGSDGVEDVVQTSPVRLRQAGDCSLLNAAQPSSHDLGSLFPFTALVSVCFQVIQKPRVRSGHHAHNRQHVDQGEVSQISDGLTAVSLRCEPASFLLRGSVYCSFIAGRPRINIPCAHHFPACDTQCNSNKANVASHTEPEPKA
jgi:hypothetical protein